jgi:hypothetical protein
MNPNDLFVGGVGLALGLFFLSAALFNWTWCYELRKTRWLAARIGRGGARIVLAVVGISLAALSVAIALGFRWQVF